MKRYPFVDIIEELYPEFVGNPYCKAVICLCVVYSKTNTMPPFHALEIIKIMSDAMGWHKKTTMSFIERYKKDVEEGTLIEKINNTTHAADFLISNIINKTQ